MTELTDEDWSLLRRKIEDGLPPIDDLIHGLGKLSIAVCIDAGMSKAEAEAVATLHDLLVGTSEGHLASRR